MEALARNVFAVERRFVDAASYLSVSILPSFSQEKAEIAGKRGASDISMQKHLAASILAAYFPAFEPSPLVSNVSLPLSRFSVSSLFLAANN